MYDEFYKFTKKPFQLTADPAFFFQSSVHRRAIAYMNYGLTQGEGFVIVTGTPGTGKTMLVKKLFRNLNKDKLQIGIVVTSQVGPEDTLRLVSSAFGLQIQAHDKASLLTNFEKFIFEKAKTGKRLLLIVDEAQNLPKQSLEELRLLTNLEINGHSIFQVFLIGQNELKRIIYLPDMEQFKQRIVSTYQLDPLDVEETRNYILFRLQHAGWQDKPAFDPEVFAAIHAFTDGIPRKINSLCDRLLLYGYLEEINLIDVSAVNKVTLEIKEEMLASKSESNVDDHMQQSISSVPPRVLSSVEERLDYLESTVASLQANLNKERILLRKAILIQLDMDIVYNDSPLKEPL